MQILLDYNKKVNEETSAGDIAPVVGRMGKILKRKQEKPPKAPKGINSINSK